VAKPTYQGQPDRILTCARLICVGDQNVPQDFISEVVLPALREQKTILSGEKHVKPGSVATVDTCQSGRTYLHEDTQPVTERHASEHFYGSDVLRRRSFRQGVLF
jgi:hypothetical protein